MKRSGSLFLPSLICLATSLAHAADIAFVVDDFDEVHQVSSVIFKDGLKERGFSEIIPMSSVPPEKERRSLFERIKAVLEAKTLRSGDRVLFYFKCHGSAQDVPSLKPSDHILCVGAEHRNPFSDDYQSVKGLNMNEVRALVQHIVGKGARAAILDTSCGSGGTVLELQGMKNVCALSTTQSDKGATFKTLDGEGNLRSVFLAVEGSLERAATQNLEQLNRAWIAAKYSDAYRRLGVNVSDETPLRTGCVESIKPLIHKDNDVNRLMAVEKTALAYSCVDYSEMRGSLAALEETLKAMTAPATEAIFKNMAREMGSHFERHGIRLPEQSLSSLPGLLRESRALAQELAAIEEREKKLERLVADPKAAMAKDDLLSLQRRAALVIVQMNALAAIVRETGCEIKNASNPNPCRDFTFYPRPEDTHAAPSFVPAPAGPYRLPAPTPPALLQK